MTKTLYLVVRLDVEVSDGTTDEQWEEIKDDISAELDYDFSYKNDVGVAITNTAICGEADPSLL